jgi:hypothetical protein
MTTPYLFCKRACNSNVNKSVSLVNHTLWDQKASASTRTLLINKENAIQISRVDLDSGNITELLQQVFYDRLRDIVAVNDGSIIAIAEGDTCSLLFLEIDPKSKRFMVSEQRETLDLLSTKNAREFQQIYRNMNWSQAMSHSLRSNMPHLLRVSNSDRQVAVANIENSIRVISLVSRDEKLHFDQSSIIEYNHPGVIWDFQFTNNSENIVAIYSNRKSGLTDIHILQVTSNMISLVQVIPGQANFFCSVFTSITPIGNTFIATIGSELYLHNGGSNSTISTGVKEDIMITAVCASQGKIYFVDELNELYSCTVNGNELGQVETVPCNFTSSVDKLLLVHEQDDLQMFITSGPFSDLSMHEVDGGVYQKLYSVPNTAVVTDFEDKYENQTSSDQRQYIVASQGQGEPDKLRIIGKGIGTNATTLSEQSYEGINGLWTLTSNGSYKFIIMSFLNVTRILLNGEESIENLNESGFEMNDTTIDCARVGDNLYIQVTPKAVILVQFRDEKDQIGREISRWKAQSTSTITTCSIDSTSILISLTNTNAVIELKVHNCSLVHDSAISIQSDVSCIHQNGLYAAIGTYDHHVTLYKKDDKWNQTTRISLEEYTSDRLGIAGSLILDIERAYIFIGMRDGTCVISPFSNNQPTVRRLGIHPVRLVKTHDRIVALSNFSWSIAFDTIRHQYDLLPIDIDDVLFLCPFSYEERDALLCVKKDNTIDVVTLNTAERMNIKSCAISEPCKRVLLIKEKHIAIVLSNNQLIVLNLLLQQQDPDYVTYVNIFDTQQENEVPLSITQWNDDIVVGTKRNQASRYNQLNEERIGAPDSDCGRVYVISIKISIQAENVFEYSIRTKLDLPGAAYAVATYDDKHIITSAGNRFIMCTLVEEKLVAIAQNNTRSFVHSISCGTSRICVTDRYDGALFFVFDQEKSLNMLQCDRAGIGGEYNRTAANVTMIDDDLVAGIDRAGSFFMLAYQQEVQQVLTVCYHYLGEIATKVKNCTLARHKMGTMPNDDRHCLVTITVTGSVICFVEISQAEYKILKKLQKLLLEKLHNRVLLKPRYKSRHVVDEEALSLLLDLPIGEGEQDELPGIQLMAELNNHLKRKDDLLTIQELRAMIRKLNAYM